MKLSVRIFISTFLIILSKVTVDIFIVSHFLLKNEILYAYRAITVSAFVGFILVYIYNVLQKKYPYIWSIVYMAVFFLSLPVAMQFIERPFSNHIFLFSIPGYILFGNVLVFLLIKGITSRINVLNSYSIERLVALAKSSSMLLLGISLILLLNYNKIALFENFIPYTYIVFTAGFLLLIRAILKTPEANESIENNQAVRVENSLMKLSHSPYFGILILFGIGIGITLSLISDLYYTNTMVTYYFVENCFKIFGYYITIFAVFGFAFEFFFRKRLMQYVGLKNNIKILPFAITAFSVLLIVEYFIFKDKPNSDFKFIFFFLLQLTMVTGHFVFEKISFPSIFSFLQPVNSNKRHDFFTKSFLIGLTAGVIISFVSLYYLRYFYFGSSNIFHPFSIGIAALILIGANIPLFKKYKHELQTLLYTRSKIKSDKFKKSIDSLKEEDLSEFTGIQFIRYINLLELIDPKLAREKVLKSLVSENNFFQRAGLVKSSVGQYLEGLTSLEEIQKTKYYKSSPNKDKIFSLSNRFIEICFRMEQKKYIDQLSISKKEKERVFGAKLTFFSDETEKEIILIRLLKDSKLSVVKSALIAALDADIESLIPLITDKLSHPALSNAAYATLLSYDNSFLPSIEKMFYQTGQNEKVQLRIIQLYGEIANEQATEFLLKKINHSNQNIVSAALKSLSKCNIILSDDKTMLLKHELDELLKILVWNISFKISINKSYLSDNIKEAITNEIRSNYDSIFNLLSLLYDYNSIRLLKENLFSYNQEKIAFSIELATILFNEDSIKPKIMPLIQPITDTELLHAMQFHAPTEEISPLEILYSLVQRDYKWINQWTKACALNELIEIGEGENIPILLANMINPDTMLAELAAYSLYRKDKETYFENKGIFKDAYTGLLDQTVLEKIEDRSRENSDFPILKYEIINYLKTIAEFSEISGETLKSLSSHILPISLQANEQFEYTDNIEIRSFHYILYRGSVSLYINDQKVKTYVPGTFITSLDLIFDYETEIRLETNERSVVYQLSPDDFSEQLSQNEGIAESVIYNTKRNRYSELEELIKRRPIIKPKKTNSVNQQITDIQYN